MSRVRKTAIAGGVAAVVLACVGHYEGLSLKSYRDIVNVPTVCYGETRGVRMGMTFTKSECDQMLLKRLDEFGEAVERCTPVAADPQRTPVRRYAALVSLAYNIGTGGYCKSSVARLLNAGRIAEACDAFLMWNRAGGRVIAGLTRRRQEERAMCREGLL